MRKRISELGWTELMNVFEKEDLLYQLTDNQMAALGDRLQVLKDRGLLWCWLEDVMWEMVELVAGRKL